VDALLDRGALCVSVLDISGVALARARTRLGAQADAVSWIEADVTAEWWAGPIDIWHDRAVFHFLTEHSDRARYLARLRQSVVPGGYVILGTFSLEGPSTCSGLPVVRYSPETLSLELGAGFALVSTADERHVTPWGSGQAFCWTVFRRGHREGSKD
jgi:hypothetical protein